MRTKNSVYNVIGAFAGQAIGILAQFIGRIVFLKYLDATYLGISGLFGNILSVLSLVELGAGTALTYSLYKPLSENNRELIKGLMALYRKIYNIIGIAILGIGLLLVPIYPVFMSEVPDIPFLTFYYVVFVVNTAITYFHSYKRALIICDQKKYLNSIVHYGIYGLICIVQSVILMLTKSYLLYLLCVTGLTFVENVIITKLADNLYPYLKEKNIQPLPQTELKMIKRNVSSMLFHKIGGIVVSSTDNILISKFLGLVQVGIYSNYLLITDALSKVTVQIFQAITASIGNLLVESDEEHIYEVFEKTFFLNAWLYGLCATCLLVLFQPFIEIYAGETYLLDMDTVILICINFYFIGIRKTVLAFRDASATYYYDRYKALVEAVFNLIFSVILVQFMGMSGIFLGTTLSMLATSIWVEPLVLYKHTLHRNIRLYFKMFFCYLSINTVACALVLWLSNMVASDGLAGFVEKTIVCIVVFNVVFVGLLGRTKEAKYYGRLLMKFYQWLKHKH